MFCKLWRPSMVHPSATTVLNVFWRCLNTSRSNSNKSFAEHVEGKTMQKLINKKGAKTKRKWYQPHVAEPLEPLGKKMASVKKGENEAQRTRARQLGHVLYDKITQIVNTGELAQELQDKQVLITSVKMNPNFGGMNVYWDADRTDALEVEELLFANSGRLRSLLISYHVLGRIPAITFVKSKGKGSSVSRINELLEVADYGPDYKPTTWYKSAESTNRLTNNSVSKTEDGNGIKPSLSENQINVHVANREVAENVDSSNISTLRDSTLVRDLTCEYFSAEGLDFHCNVYSLPHEDLMKKVMAKKSKKHLNDEETVINSKDYSEYSEKLASLERIRMRSKAGKESTKVKQKRLERDVQDFLSMTTPRSVTDNDHIDDDFDEHDDVGDDNKNL
ncbi:uncharacterized protein LOC101858541 [Aplysia californica]|uniref:Uncharacterized protein LOC101858541 n=1 Tax=Aplysia californica TaxID=6500 RepID=A0ABM0JDQ8_APLCA|nr:uncharacterized protein LOC101858541 [Aplysia californica]